MLPGNSVSPARSRPARQWRRGGRHQLIQQRLQILGRSITHAGTDGRPHWTTGRDAQQAAPAANQRTVTVDLMPCLRKFGHAARVDLRDSPRLPLRQFERRAFLCIDAGLPLALRVRRS